MLIGHFAHKVRALLDLAIKATGEPNYYYVNVVK